MQPAEWSRDRKQSSVGDDSRDSIELVPPSSPERLTREEVLSALGYKTGNAKSPLGVASSSGHSFTSSGNKSQSTCQRCGKKVYPQERIDIGEVYHRGCFKCLVCGIQLTLKTFSRVKDFTSETSLKEIYCRNHQPWHSASAFGGDAVEIKTAIAAQKKASEKHVVRQYERSPSKYDGEALEFQHARDIKQRHIVRIKKYSSFKKLGVFDAQKELEEKHRNEEDELYQEMLDERRSLLQQLDQQLVAEREQTVHELIIWFEQQGLSRQERDIGLSKVERLYRKQREDRMKSLLDKMAVEEQAAITRLIDKHAQEMLFLIQEKQDKGEMMFEGEDQAGYARGEERIEKRRTYRSEMTVRPSANKKTKDGGKSREESGRDDELETREEEEEEEDIGGEMSAEDQEDEQNDEVIEHGTEDDDIRPEQDDREKKDDENISSDDSWESGSEEDIGKKYELGKKIGMVKQDHPQAQGQHGDNEGGGFDSQEEAVSSLGSWESGEDEDDEAGSEEGQKKLVNNTYGYGKSWPATSTSRVSHLTEAPGEVTVSRVTVVDKNRHENTSFRDAEIQVEPKEKGKGEKETQTGKDSKRDKKSEKQHRKSQNYDDDDDDDDVNDDDLSTKHSKHDDKRNTTKKHRKQRESQDASELDTTATGKDVKNKNATVLKQIKTKSPAGRKFQLTIRMEKRPPTYDEDQQDESEDGDVLPSYGSRPEICPPKCRKSKLYTDADVFTDLDRRAIREARKDPTSFTDLVRRLSRKCQTDIQCVRAIFRWITAKDLNKIEFSESIDTDTPMGLLRGIKFGTETYHNLFKRLCSYAGLHCEIIEGYSKGAGYQPGSHFHGHKFRNQWTAVWVDGSWRFINCNWGARHVSRQGDEQPIYQIDEFYFLTDPDEHIYQHFPDDPRWQLLRIPLRIEDFVQLPVVKSPFFNSRLQFVAKTGAILKTSTGATEVRLVTPGNVAVAAKLRSNDAGDHKLTDRCIVRLVGDVVVVSAVMRLPGKYYMDIFVGTDWQCDSMDSACSLRVHCRSVSPAVENISYPPGICFGPTPDFANFGLSEGHTRHDPLLVAAGEIKVRFRTTSAGDEDVRLTHTLRHWKAGSLVDCDRFAVLSTYARATATWVVRCPKFGMYALSVLAAFGDGDPRCVYRFLIDCQKPVANARPLPRATTRWRHCRLVEPLDGELYASSPVRFRIESISAEELLINVGGGTWTALTQTGNTWEAVVQTGEVGVEGSGKLVVYGRFDKNSDKYVPLLSYVVREQSYTEEVRGLLKYM